ncbi:MAG: phosphodiester glycosidase family protein [Chloroflexi bacterium]|nr:phosphodiester glycosidase family protein [Chloroflexota bacterium]
MLQNIKTGARGLGLLVYVCFLMLARPDVVFSNHRAAVLPANCKPDALKFAGITHCVLDGEKNTHVVLVNLETAGLRFETALSLGPNGQECKDVNTQQWAVAGRGCSAGPVYPFETVASMAGRYPGVRVAINADYFGSKDHGHGAEGLTIKNGQRLDGWEWGDCDGNQLDRAGKIFHFRSPTACNGNDVNRPALTIARNNRVEIGYRAPQEVDNKALYADRFYNAVGGGPLIVVGGKPQDNTACNNADSFKALPKGAVCDPKSQMAVALSGDGKTLILAMADRDAAGMAKLYTETFQEYRVQTALKLDGGGSPALWYDGQIFGTSISQGKREVAEALLIFAPAARELDATVANSADFAVAEPGKPLTLNLTFANAGTRAWNTPELTLVNVNNQPLGADAIQHVGGVRQIAPGASLPLTVMLRAPTNAGLYASEWQLKSGDQNLGPKVTFNVIVLPPEAKELRERIQTEIENWRKSGEQKVDELVRQIQKEIEEWVKREASGLIERTLRQMGCNVTLLILFGVVLGVNLLRLRR